MHGMYGEWPGLHLVELAESRNVSGTSWQPDDVPVYFLGGHAGLLEAKVRGNVFVFDQVQDSDKGAQAVGSVGHVGAQLAMVTSRAAVGARATASLEPYFLSPEGVP